jgi:tetratricopeptide (TPR) repeat protein
MQNMMEKKHSKTLITILGFIYVMSLSIQISAQDIDNAKSAEGKFFEVAKMLEAKQFDEAIALSQKLSKQYPTNPDVYLLWGLGYINVGNKADSAQMVLNKGLSLLSADEQFSESGINIRLSLGKAYQLNLQPQKSIDVYRQLIGNIPVDSLSLAEEINHEMQTCENAKLYLANPIALTIKNLGPNVNSKFDEHTPLISIDGQKLVFTSRRQHAGLSKLDDGQYPEKIYFSNNSNQAWSGSESTTAFYKRNDHESAVSVSPNGKQMFLFKSDLDGKNLYVSELTNNNTWGVPAKLPEPINSYSHETHCSLSADGSTMFFTSDRDGGFGGLDIYMCKKMPNGNWGNARNLGANINTSYNEETPMVYLDGKTLYFASEGHTSMGMYDIFYACMQPDSTWSEPVNLGYPINSPSDDLFFVPTIERNQAYYSTAQFNDNLGGMDIYHIEFDPHFKGKLAVIEGKVMQDGNAKTIRILVSRADDQQLVGDYRPDPQTGDYLMFLETGQRYAIKEVKQYTIEEVVGEINVSDEMAYSEVSHPLQLHDIGIEPPLKPTEQLLAQNTVVPQTLAQVAQQSEIDPNAMAAAFATDPNKNNDGDKAMVAPSGQITVPSVIATSTELPSSELRMEGYTVQLIALNTKRLKNFNIFKGLDLAKISETKCKDGFYRYTYATFLDKQSSLAVRQKIVTELRFKDAFIRPVSQLADLRAEEK